MPAPRIARNDIGGKHSGNELARHLMNSLGGAKEVEPVEGVELMRMERLVAQYVI